MNAVTPTEAAGPAAILTALCKAMGQVQKVAKDGRNKHDGYNFASIDDFLALVNPICAENGLIVHMQEGTREDFERTSQRGTSAWMRQSFDLTLYHVSGESLPPVTRTVEVLRNGAQAYGSAQSYALKQFWRSILLIPTGDKDDADFAPTDDAPVTRARREPDRPREDAGLTAAQIEPAMALLREAASVDALKTAWGRIPVDVQKDGRVLAIKDARKAELTAPPTSDLAKELGDSIPY